MMNIASRIPAQATLPDTFPPIWETHEPLIPLKQYAPALEVYPVYYHAGLPSRKARLYRSPICRRAFALRSELIACDLHLVILDGWRPLEVQQSLYNQFKHRSDEWWHFDYGN